MVAACFLSGSELLEGGGIVGPVCETLIRVGSEPVLWIAGRVFW